MTVEDFLDDMPLESEYSNEEPEDVVIDPFEFEDPDPFKFEDPEEDIELEEPMVIPQEDYNIVLEKGDKIKVLSKEKINEQEDYDVNELVKMIDYTWLIKYFNELNIPVKNIKTEVYRNYIKAEAGTFFGNELGIFRYALKEAKLSVFNVGLSKNKQGHLTLWYSWTLEYTTLDGGTNGVSFIDTWYDFVTNTWQTKMKGR
jgi:hypothetical protein